MADIVIQPASLTLEPFKKAKKEVKQVKKDKE